MRKYEFGPLPYIIQYCTTTTEQYALVHIHSYQDNSAG